MRSYEWLRGRKVTHATCFLGAFPPVDFLAVCLVLAILLVLRFLDYDSLLSSNIRLTVTSVNITNSRFVNVDNAVKNAIEDGHPRLGRLEILTGEKAGKHGVLSHSLATRASERRHHDNLRRQRTSRSKIQRSSVAITR